MLFNSYVFWTFFAVVFLLYRLLNHRWQNYQLLAAGAGPLAGADATLTHNQEPNRD